MHFCGDDFQRINLYGESKTCCESQEPMPGCCADVSHLELPNSDQQLTEIIHFQPLRFDFILPTFQFELSETIIGISEKTAFSDSAPPILQDTPIYIFCQVFLI
nr:hypothetical protein [Cognataquiflexum nitidum]